MELFENWSQTKEALLTELPEHKKAYMGRIMENTKAVLTETAAAGVNAAGAIGNFQKIIIPMIRRIIPGTIATELVGIQPMSGPVSLAYSLRFLFSNTTDGGAAGASPEDIVGTELGLAGATEVFANNSKTKRWYSGGPQGAGPTTGFAATTDDFEAYGGRQLQLEVLKQTVTAGSRKLQAKWTVEAMQDLSAQHGLDLEAEITAALSAEIVSEIDNEIINDLIALAGSVDTFDMNGTFTGVPNYVGDRHAVLGVLINKVAMEIARKTRRGQANWIVVSPLVGSVLQSAAKSVFAPAVSGSFEGPNNTKLIGTLNGTIKVYTYIYHDQGNEPILLGYKGGNGEMDTGYFYCPYVPLMSSNVVIDPATYNPQVSLMTRYGKATFVNSATSLGNSADYYGRITVANLSFI
jgi:hypothetical protein